MEVNLHGDQCGDLLKHVVRIFVGFQKRIPFIKTILHGLGISEATNYKTSISIRVLPSPCRKQFSTRTIFVGNDTRIYRDIYGLEQF